MIVLARLENLIDYAQCHGICTKSQNIRQIKSRLRRAHSSVYAIGGKDGNVAGISNIRNHARRVIEVGRLQDSSADAKGGTRWPAFDRGSFGYTEKGRWLMTTGPGACAGQTGGGGQ